MRRRLDIAMSLIGNPPVIFLDEPTAGLDPQARIEVWQAVKELAEGGTTVLLTTQYLDKADIWTVLAWCAGILAVAYTFANIAYRRRIS